MTKADIVNEVSNATGLTKVETEAVLEGIIKAVSSSLKQNKRVDIRGFGSFFTKIRESRIARNPSNNQLVKLDRRYVPYFKVSKLLRKCLNVRLGF